jgi:acyl-homoserine-lactone acylase
MILRAFRLLTLVCLALTLIPSPAKSADAADDPLARQVTIRRDKFGVPHILAQSEEAAYFGQAYASAEDHVLVMARLYLKARGEEAAYFGDAFADADFAVKQLHIWDGAKEGYARLAPWVQRILDGYAAGYNRYVAKHRSQLPEWVKPATGIDILAHGRRVVIVEFTMDRGILKELGYKSASLPNQKGEWSVVSGKNHHSPLTYSPLTMGGSNMWAIGKGRTASGKGILLGNPHLPWSGHHIFYESHVTVPGKVNLYGCTTVGSPGITIGFNDNLGWSHTVNLHDSDDIYELTLDPKNKDHYLYDGKSLPLTKEELTIQVKTDAGLVPRTRAVLRSHYGPTKKTLGGKALAWKSANFDEYRFVEQWNLMGKAKNLPEFRNVQDMQSIPMFNICYADKDGNVFYLFNGRFPDRPQGYKWDGIVPGNTSATEWSRMLPQSRLPSLLNPPGGYVQNCNSAPWYTNLNKTIDRRQFPDDLTPNFCLLRQQLSLQMLHGDRPVDLAKVLKDKYATRLLLADRVKDDVLKLTKFKADDEPELDQAIEVLRTWDNSVARDSKGSLLFVQFWKNYCQLCKRPDREEWYRKLYAIPWDERRPAETPSGIGDMEAARKALNAAVREMKKTYGKLDIVWGDVHRMRRGNVDVPISGFTDEGGFPVEFGAFRIIRCDPDRDGKFKAVAGDSFVMAVEFTSPPTAYSISAYSQSSDPASPHHTDQSVLFADEKWKRVCFTEEDISKNLERSYQP